MPRMHSRPTPSQTPDGKDLPLSTVVGDEGGAGISAGGSAGAKSGAGVQHDERCPDLRRASFWKRLTWR